MNIIVTHEIIDMIGMLDSYEYIKNNQEFYAQKNWISNVLLPSKDQKYLKQKETLAIDPKSQILQYAGQFNTLDQFKISAENILRKPS